MKKSFVTQKDVFLIDKMGCLPSYRQKSFNIKSIPYIFAENNNNTTKYEN